MYRRRRDVDLSASRHRLAPLAQAVTRTQDRQEAHPRPLICFSPGSSSSDDQMVFTNSEDDDDVDHNVDGDTQDKAAS